VQSHQDGNGRASRRAEHKACRRSVGFSEWVRQLVLSLDRKLLSSSVLLLRPSQHLHSPLYCFCCNLASFCGSSLNGSRFWNADLAEHAQTSDSRTPIALPPAFSLCAPYIAVFGGYRVFSGSQSITLLLQPANPSTLAIELPHSLPGMCCRAPSANSHSKLVLLS